MLSATAVKDYNAVSARIRQRIADNADAVARKAELAVQNTQLMQILRKEFSTDTTGDIIRDYFINDLHYITKNWSKSYEAGTTIEEIVAEAYNDAMDNFVKLCKITIQEFLGSDRLMNGLRSACCRLYDEMETTIRDEDEDWEPLYYKLEGRPIFDEIFA